MQIPFVSVLSVPKTLVSRICMQPLRCLFFPPCKAVLHYPRKITGKLIDQAETPAPADRRCDPVLFLGRGTGKETMALFSYLQNSKILQDFSSHQIFERMHKVLNVAK